MLLKNILKLQKCLIFLCVTCFVPGIWAGGEGNHSEAIESCKGRGGLATSKLFHRVPGTWSMPSFDNRDFMTYGKLLDVTLSAGESAWVAGYAEFGEFYTLNGCQDANKWKSTHTTNVSHVNNVFECGEFCKDKDKTPWRNVGLYQTKCVCFPRVVNPLQNSYDNCKTSNDNILFTFKLLYLHGSKKLNFQCGMIEHNGAEWIQSSAKCLNSLSVMCNKHERETERTDTWSDAVEFCGNASDKMYSYLTTDMVAKANRSNKYWLSAFRSFRVHEQYSQNTQACPSVTRTGNSLILQPDDCGISQKYICADGIDKAMDNNSNPNTTTGIVIGMIALVVGVSLIIAGVICLRRRKAIKGSRKPIVSKSSIETNVIKGTCAISNTTGHRASSGNEIMEEHEYDTPGDATDRNTVSSTKPNSSKIRPDKPDRDTSRQNQKLQKNYENFKHVSTENRKFDSDVDFKGEVVAKTDKHEYVALNQNMAPQSTEHEYAEMHVNNTPVQNDDN